MTNDCNRYLSPRSLCRGGETRLVNLESLLSSVDLLSRSSTLGGPALIGDKYQVYVTFRSVYVYENVYLAVDSANSPWSYFIYCGLVFQQ